LDSLSSLFYEYTYVHWYSFEQGPGLEDAVEEALEKARGELKGMAVREEEAMETSSRVEQNNKERLAKRQVTMEVGAQGGRCGEMWKRWWGKMWSM